MASSPSSKVTSRPGSGLKIVHVIFDHHDGEPRKNSRRHKGASPQWVASPSKFSRPSVERLFDKDLEVVKFYDAHTDSPFYRFSSFACFPLFIEGLKFASVEHYLEYKKFLTVDPEFAEKLRNTRTPYDCKKMSKTARDRGDPDWISKGLQLSCMRTTLFNKAMQWPEFLNDLLSTGRAYIVQTSPYDSFWGVGNEGKGANTLGKLLVELRAELIPFHHLRFQDFVPQLEPVPVSRNNFGPRRSSGAREGEYFPRVPRGPVRTQGAEVIDVDDYAENPTPSSAPEPADSLDSEWSSSSD